MPKYNLLAVPTTWFKRRSDGENMAEFRSWRSYKAFSQSVKQKARYVREKTAEEFLQTVLNTCHARKLSVPKDRIFWRAQNGFRLRTVKQDSKEFEVPSAHSAERMKPQRGSAPEGRVNPKGIPYLYLATDKETAMAEVRHLWVHTYRLVSSKPLKTWY